LNEALGRDQPGTDYSKLLLNPTFQEAVLFAFQLAALFATRKRIDTPGLSGTRTNGRVPAPTTELFVPFPKPKANLTGDFKGIIQKAKIAAPNRPSGYTRMQDYIPELGKPSLPATTRLTQQQVLALQENLQAVVNQSIPGYRQLIASGRPRAEVVKGLQNQMNLLRWRFIDQVPGGREAIQGILREFPEITFPH
jgi:hypothetical protein